MAKSGIRFIIVRNAQPRILPRWLRVFLGEVYMYVDVFPGWTPDLQCARQFLSFAAADAYIVNRDNQRRAGMRDAVIRTYRVKI